MALVDIPLNSKRRALHTSELIVPPVLTTGSSSECYAAGYADDALNMVEASADHTADPGRAFRIKAMSVAYFATGPSMPQRKRACRVMRLSSRHMPKRRRMRRRSHSKRRLVRSERGRLTSALSGSLTPPSPWTTARARRETQQTFSHPYCRSPPPALRDRPFGHRL